MKGLDSRSPVPCYRIVPFPSIRANRSSSGPHSALTPASVNSAGRRSRRCLSPAGEVRPRLRMSPCFMSKNSHSMARERRLHDRIDDEAPVPITAEGLRETIRLFSYGSPYRGKFVAAQVCLLMRPERAACTGPCPNCSSASIVETGIRIGGPPNRWCRAAASPFSLRAVIVMPRVSIVPSWGCLSEGIHAGPTLRRAAARPSLPGG
jgi:hypothetical protein